MSSVWVLCHGTELHSGVYYPTQQEAIDAGIRALGMNMPPSVCDAFLRLDGDHEDLFVIGRNITGIHFWVKELEKFQKSS